MKRTLPANATFRDLTGTPPKREEYLRRVVQNLEGHGAYRDAITVRMGVAGRGISPHYKFETPVEYRMRSLDGADLGAKAGFPEAFFIYHGASHKKMTAFELADVRDAHWSLKAMSYEDVRAIFGQVRAERKGL
jgi:hypothetical protein